MNRIIIIPSTVILVVALIVLLANAEDENPYRYKSAAGLNKEMNCPDSAACTHAKKGDKSCCEIKKGHTAKCDPKACDPVIHDTTKCKPESCSHNEVKMTEKKCSSSCTSKCQMKTEKKK